MAKPTLHGPAYSTYVRTARLAFEEKAVEYELDHFDFMKGEAVTANTPNLRRWWDNIKGRESMVRTRPEFSAAG